MRYDVQTNPNIAMDKPAQRKATVRNIYVLIGILRKKMNNGYP